MLKSFLSRLVRIARRLLLGEPRLSRSIQGQGNLFQADGARLFNVELDIIGDRNRITVGEGSTLINLKFHLRGSDQVVEIGKNCRVTRGGLFWMEDDHCSLIIGQSTSMVEVHIAVTEPGSKVVIGEECMFANDIDVRSGDSHSILDASTGERINFAENVIIGRHVWVASHAILLKGVELGEDSVVAAGAVVTKSCEPGSILAGNPAKVIKSGISWKRERMAKE
jgi:acetyltransferase-like isoleucine patch superfamily enzyme